jgi:DnaK suppressor protein
MMAKLSNKRKRFMNETDGTKVRKVIADEVQRLKKEIVRLEERVQPVAPDDAIGRISRLDNMVNQEVATHSLEQARSRIVRLQWMLENVGDEELGLCRDCGDEIPLARVLAVPESGLCLECAEDYT